MHEHAHRVPQATWTAPLPASSRTFPATARHIGEARRFLAAILDGCPAADDAVLCVSELASNATTHSNSRRPGGTFTVCARVRAGCLRVEVHDEGGPWNQPVGSQNATHGRGLLIVTHLTRAWGRTGDSDTGWRVWFEMECP
jgi:serine/threonine-protein kinase RsbW